MLNIALLNVGVQLSAPRWVTARAIAWFQSALTGGIALGAWMWGHVAADWGLTAALIASGIALVLTPLIGLVSPMPRVSAADVEMIDVANEPEVALAITARSGPIVIEFDYRVDPDSARQFYDVMLKMQLTRLRNGAFDWSLSRDIADPALWTERYHCPTWADYLRLRSRFTHSDRELQALADAFHTAGPAPRSPTTRAAAGLSAMARGDSRSANRSDQYLPAVRDLRTVVLSSSSMMPRRAVAPLPRLDGNCAWSLTPRERRSSTGLTGFTGLPTDREESLGEQILWFFGRGGGDSQRVRGRRSLNPVNPVNPVKISVRLSLSAIELCCGYRWRSPKRVESMQESSLSFSGRFVHSLILSIQPIL